MKVSRDTNLSLCDEKTILAYKLQTQFIGRSQALQHRSISYSITSNSGISNSLCKYGDYSRRIMLVMYLVDWEAGVLVFDVSI